MIKIIVCLVILLSACVAVFLLKRKGSDCRPLSVAELAFFNGDEFFNGEKMNICHQFLSSLYTSPEEIDLFQLFYFGNGIEKKPATEDEKVAVLAQNNIDVEPNSKFEKNSCAEMDTILKKYTGIRLGETRKKGLEKMTFMEKYNAYYCFRKDAEYRKAIYFYTGIMVGNLVQLYYKDDFYKDGEKILTLKVVEGGFVFVSNLMKPSR